MVSAAPQKGPRRWWLFVLVAVVAALAISAKFFGLGDKLEDLQAWIESLGSLGPVAFILVYVAAVCLAIPGFALTVGAGALFGSLMGVIYVSIASTIGASLAFLISRYFARDTVANWLSKNETFGRLDTLVEKHGAVIVALTRLVPLFPFNLLNYGFGLTRVRFSTYVLWSWICMLPGTILFVVGADAVVSAVKDGRVPWVLVGILAAVVVFLILIVRVARRSLAEKEGPAARDAPGDKENRDG